MKEIIIEYVNRFMYKIGVHIKLGKMALQPEVKEEIIDKFHRLYYDYSSIGGTWNNTFFLGVATQKCPLDLFIYQEIIYEVKPDIIIETGTAYGGGALYLAKICDLINKGQVITIDIKNSHSNLHHKRITYLIGSSTSKEIISKLKKLINNKRKILVILDSDHSKNHVLNELRIYSGFVSKNSYIIVEDSNVNGHPVNPNHGPGPMEALKEFIKENRSFVIDKTKEKFLLTFNPNGYLKKIS